MEAQHGIAQWGDTPRRHGSVAPATRVVGMRSPWAWARIRNPRRHADDERIATKRSMRPPNRVLAAVLLLVAQFTNTHALHAQKSSECICSQSFTMVTLSLVDANDAPVQDATVQVRRARTGTTRTLTADAPGVYTVADDMMRNSVRMDGEPFEVSVRWHGRTQRVTTTIGTRLPTKTGSKTRSSADSCRCHVVRISGAEKLVLR